MKAAFICSKATCATGQPDEGVAKPKVVFGWLIGLVVVAATLFLTGGRAAAQLIVISLTGGSVQTICDTDCVTCTVGSGECVEVTEADLIMCNPISIGVDGEVTGCDWSILFDGDDAGVNDNDEINQQMRALEIAPNGNLAFVVTGNDVVPGIGTLNNNDMAVLTPTDILQPYVGGGPYTTASGPLKIYLDGVMSQSDAAAKPWDALELLTDGTCENTITATGSGNHTCPVIGSLTGGNTDLAKFNGHKFKNEDLVRCRPTGFAGNGAVTGCDYSVMLDATAMNGGGSSGITSDIEAIDFLTFNPATMTGQMVFQKKSGTPDGFPAHEPGRDLLLYNGGFGSGECVPSANPCAADSDCPMGETCDTGECSLTTTPCSTDEDCTGGGDLCTHTRPYNATITLFFDGSAVGLSGVGQRIEGFSIVPDLDDDQLPDGIDNCPNVDNPPSVCSGPGSETCPGGLSSECPMGETCVQADDDGDGVGDPCDQCNGRDDAVCFCGDFILDFPSEDCDLGDPGNSGFNGEPASPCSLTCQVTGSCTTSNTPCDSADDCPIGEGCCGDAVEDSPAEDCDDGNSIDDDACDNECQDNPLGTPLIGCDGVTGPHVVPAFVKVTKLKDSGDPAPDLNRWKAVGDANFAAGVTIDPDTEPVTITFNNNLSGVIFQKTLPSSNFSQFDPKLKWKFFDKPASIVPGWRKGKFIQRDNKVKFVLDGRNITVATVAQLDVGPPNFRQTVRVGDVCLTKIVTCEVKGGGKTVKCPP